MLCFGVALSAKSASKTEIHSFMHSFIHSFMRRTHTHCRRIFFRTHCARRQEVSARFYFWIKGIESQQHDLLQPPTHVHVYAHNAQPFQYVSVDLTLQTQANCHSARLHFPHCARTALQKQLGCIKGDCMCLCALSTAHACVQHSISSTLSGKLLRQAINMQHLTAYTRH